MEQINVGDTVEALRDYSTLPQHPDISPRMKQGEQYQVMEVGDQGNAIGVRLSSPLTPSTLQYVPKQLFRKI